MQGFESDSIDSTSEPSSSGLGFAGLTEFLGLSAVAGGEDLGPGTKLGDVTIVRLVGEGGMGRVYEGLQGMPCRTVAVKVVRPGVLSPAAAKRFEHEAQILGRLTHPGIARIYSVGMQQLTGCSVPYFVMEYVDDAQSITAYATQHDLSTRDRVKLFREACAAVAHGHHKGVIHRDLKPGNILVDALGQPKIIDFGVARSTDGDVALTTMHTDIGQLVGTLQYMCPEQFDGSSDDLDIRADVYSLGVVFYELLAGRLPYDLTRRAVYEVARVVQEVEPKSLSTVNPRLRGDLNTIVTKCLEKERSRRYSSAAELEADLGRYLRGEPIAASPPQLLDAIVRLARRHRLAATAAAGVVAALVLAVVGISIFAVRAEQQRILMIGEQTRADAEADTARQRLYVANLRSLQSCLATKNLRMARQVCAENLAITGTSLPLEMRCLAAGLDDSLVVLDSQQSLERPVIGVAYSPNGGTFAATVVDPPKSQQIQSPRIQTLIMHPATVPNMSTSLMFFSVGPHHRYAPRDAGAQEWVPVRRTRNRNSKNLGNAADDSTGPLAISPDGRQGAEYAHDGAVRIVDRATGQDKAVLEGHRGLLETAAFVADGSRLITLGSDRRLRLWDAESGRLMATCGGADARIQAFECSLDGSRIAAVVMGGANRWHDVVLYDTVDGRQLSTVTVPKSLGPSDSLLAISPDGSHLVTTSHEDDLHVWDVADGGAVATLAGHAAVVTAVAISPDGSQIASGAKNGHIRLWNARTFAMEWELMGHDGPVLSLAFGPDGKTLASGSYDGTARIWSRTTAEPLAVLPGLHGMTAVTFSPDGRQLAVAPKGSGDVELWNPQTVERLSTLPGAGGIVSQLAYSPDGTLVAAAFKKERKTCDVRVWRTATGELLSTLGEHALGAQAVTFSPDGARLLTTAGDATVMVWDPRTGRRLMANPAGNWRGPFEQTAAVFGLDGSRVAYKKPYLLDSATGSVATELRPQGQVSCLAASPDGRVLATAMAIGTVYLSEFATGNRRADLIGHTGSVRSMAFSADGARLATGSLDGDIRLWDAGNGDSVRLFRGHEGNVEAVVFSPDGRRIISSATDGTIRIWDAGLGDELCALSGDKDFPTAIALSPDGTQLVTAGADGMVQIQGLSNAAVVKARQAAAAAAPDAAAPQASRETRPDRPDPAG